MEDTPDPSDYLWLYKEPKEIQLSQDKVRVKEISPQIITKIKSKKEIISHSNSNTKEKFLKRSNKIDPAHSNFVGINALMRKSRSP